MTNAVIAKLDAVQLENVTAKLLNHVDSNDPVSRFALDTHLFELNEHKGSAAIADFASRFFKALAA